MEERKKRVEIDEILKNKDKYIGKEVYLRGWVRNIRFSKSIRVYRIKWWK